VTLPFHLALVSLTPAVPMNELSRIAAALQRQTIRDFAPLWDLQATIDAFEELDDIPVGYWPVVIAEDIGHAGITGIHLDERNQPFALVQRTRSWSLTASHEVLEILADPFGNRLVPADHPDEPGRRVEYLMEVCDPCQDAAHSYRVNGVLVSDFITPQFYDPVASAGVRYSFNGAVQAPRHIPAGGYMSYRDPATGEWSQSFGDREARPLGRPEAAVASLRNWIDGRTEHPQLDEGLDDDDPALNAAREAERHARHARSVVADGWRARLEALLPGAGSGMR
jgi:hypothetical protein